jgi:hypothetical protein
VIGLAEHAMAAEHRNCTRLVMALVILAVLLTGGWWVVARVREAVRTVETGRERAEGVREVCLLTLDFVEQRKDWPRSWEDLMSLTRWTHARDPRAWSPPLRALVQVDFGVPLEEMREESPSTFRAIRPLGGPAASPLDEDYARFLSKLRELVPRQ